MRLGALHCDASVPSGAGADAGGGSVAAVPPRCIKCKKLQEAARSCKKLQEPPHGGVGLCCGAHGSVSVSVTLTARVRSLVCVRASAVRG